MKLVLLGTGGYFPTCQRHTACLMLPEIGVLLDAGTGMCHMAEYLRTERLDIFLTHAHLDHITGLTYLVNLLPPAVLSRTTVHGEPDKIAAVQEHLFAQSIFPVQPKFGFQPLRASFSLPEGGTLTHFSLTHPGGSVGYRLDWPGHSLAYVTDTTAALDANYVDRIRGVDLLIHEAYFANDRANLPAVTGHSWLKPVTQVAAAAGVGRLVIVHLDPQLDVHQAFDLTAARNIFPNTEIGADRMEITF